MSRSRHAAAAGSTDDALTADRRKETRARIEIDAQCRTSDARELAKVVEISTHGCRILASNFSLVPGNGCFIRLNGFESMRGEIRWRHDGILGVKFNSPLYLPVVEHISRVHPARRAPGED